jgi:TolB-like protein/Tfp pilus assembly protein PilF
MASLIPGYEYDIFISYRQKDNRGDRWVSEFVEALKTELESTFKEEISVYFDINPHDGLLETHDVDASLKDKLKCLVFIPIISRTYCDPNSYAWQFEFLAFNKLAREDRFGRDIKLKNGNYASRILPIRIHDLETEDVKLFEKETGSVLRAMDFVFKTASGVNRPLKANEDHLQDNLNKTFYSDQINKVANAVKEINSGLKLGPSKSFTERKEVLSTKEISAIQEKSVAVLPFVNMCPEKDQDYFCDGITEEIINALSHIENFKVIARTSAFAFKDKQVDIREIGRILDVDTLLEGSIRKEGNRLRITVQLIKVADGSHIWSERYDREMKDVFAIQDEISLAIADILKVKLLGGNKAMITKRHSENLEAYNLYLKGNYCWQLLTADGYKKASEYFEHALQKDSNYALAYVGLGFVNFTSTFWANVPPHEAFPKAFEYVKKALKIDSLLAEAYMLLGYINSYYYWNWKESERNFKHALQINPNSSMIHLFYSQLLTISGHHEEAIFESIRAQQLDPLSSLINTSTGNAFLFAGQLDRAIEEYRMSLKINPNYWNTHLLLGAAYFFYEMFKEAVAEFEKAFDLSDGIPYVTAYLVCTYYLIGEKDKAEKQFDSLKKRSESEYIPATSFFLIHKFRGEEDLALEWLKRACNEHDSWLPWLKLNHPMFFSEGSRYMILFKEVGLL